MTSNVRTPSGAASKNHNRRVAIVSGALVLGLLGSGGLVLRGTEAAFTASTVNPSNAWTAGQLSLSDDDLGAAMFKVADAKLLPGDPAVVHCITVHYGGDAATPVKLYTPSVTGTGAGAGNLAGELQLTIEQGTGTVDANCTGTFTEDTAAGAYVAGNLYSGTLNGFSSTADYATGKTAWTPSTAQDKVFKFTVALPGTATNGAGQVVNANFVWEAKAGS